MDDLLNFFESDHTKMDNRVPDSYGNILQQEALGFPLDESPHPSMGICFAFGIRQGCKGRRHLRANRHKFSPIFKPQMNIMMKAATTLKYYESNILPTHTCIKTKYCNELAADRIGLDENTFKLRTISLVMARFHPR
jgi:hypothetical protein